MQKDTKLLSQKLKLMSYIVEEYDEKLVVEAHTSQSRHVVHCLVHVLDDFPRNGVARWNCDHDECHTGGWSAISLQPPAIHSVQLITCD